jgi:hypothetical protein
MRPSYIDSMPATMLAMLNEVLRESGLVGAIFLTGADPSQGGQWINIR